MQSGMGTLSDHRMMEMMENNLCYLAGICLVLRIYMDLFLCSNVRGDA